MFLCDNGTNFVVAARELKELSEVLQEKKTQDIISQFCSSQSIEWKFIQERATHIGGLWLWWRVWSYIWNELLEKSIWPLYGLWQYSHRVRLASLDSNSIWGWWNWNTDSRTFSHWSALGGYSRSRRLILTTINPALMALMPKFGSSFLAEIVKMNILSHCIDTINGSLQREMYRLMK